MYNSKCISAFVWRKRLLLYDGCGCFGFWRGHSNPSVISLVGGNLSRHLAYVVNWHQQTCQFTAWGSRLWKYFETGCIFRTSYIDLEELTEAHTSPNCCPHAHNNARDRKTHTSHDSGVYKTLNIKYYCSNSWKASVMQLSITGPAVLYSLIQCWSWTGWRIYLLVNWCIQLHHPQCKHPVQGASQKKTH